MNAVVEYNQEQMSLLKRTLAEGATSDEFSLFVNQCKRTQLDPFTRQIYFIKDKKGKVTVCASIDGLRLVAERSGSYEGQTKPEWCGKDGVWKDIWLLNEPPIASRIGVWKTKFREPTYGVALFDEYCGKYPNGDLTYMWAKMPSLMIAKVAEALALRKAFPNDLSGIYSSEEADVIQTKDIKPTGGGAQIEGPANSTAPAPTPAVHKNEQQAPQTPPKLKNEAKVDLKMASNLITKLKMLNKDGDKFYEWLKSTYGTRIPIQLKVYQYEEIIELLDNQVR